MMAFGCPVLQAQEGDDARRLADDPSRPYAYDPGDARRLANHPSRPPVERPTLWIGDPHYAQYR